MLRTVRRTLSRTPLAAPSRRAPALAAGLVAAGMVAALAGLASTAAAQQRSSAPVTNSAPGGAPVTTTTPAQAVSTGHPGRDTLLRLMRPVTVDLRDQRLEDVINFFVELTGAEIEPLWLDDRAATGLDRDVLITVRINNRSALDALEAVLARATTDVGTDANTWQLTDYGSLQVGPRSRLNAFKRVEMYDINDLLLEIPDAPNAPEFDLNTVFQATGGGGGGGSQSPFQQQNQNQNENRRTREERATELINILTRLVESDQWEDNGGTGGSIEFYQGALIVNAPDYMHRGLNGYTFWPARYTRTVSERGRRYVTLDMDTAYSDVTSFAQRRINATTGNAGGSGGGGGGGGGGPPGGGGNSAPNSAPGTRPGPGGR